MKVILFDLDGTLMNTLQDITDSVNFAMEKTGYPARSAAEVRLAVGNGVVKLIENLLPDESEEQREKILEIFRPYYALHAMDKSAPYDGLPSVLNRLQKNGYVCGIVSNKPDEATRGIGKRFFPTFPLALGQREDIPRKPDAAPIEFALHALGGTKDECIYVGDSEVDVKTAKNAGVPCIAVTWGFRDESVLLDAGASHLAHTPEELYEQIVKLL
ncbi:MAG: HAD family hydrolase [Clostridia bacterium]|nr:HAD family hydrolase [Clostridia bacterium]